MKKVLTLLIITITIAGCKKSDNPTNPIIGTWATGQDIAIYYTAGKEVYRQTNPRPSHSFGHLSICQRWYANLKQHNGRCIYRV